MKNHNRSLALALAMLLVPLTGCVASQPTVGVSMTGIDHLPEHLSIQNFWVNGAAGQQAGKGGRTVCCASIPSDLQRPATVKVRWAVTNWKRRVYGYYERAVPIEAIDADGSLYVHFLRGGEVRAILYDGYPEGGAYPGPSYATVPRDKKPWTDYKRKPGEPEFAEVNDPMKD